MSTEVNCYFILVNWDLSDYESLQHRKGVGSERLREPSANGKGEDLGDHKGL